MDALLDRAEKASPTAAAILKQAREKGVSYVFSDNLKKAYGGYIPCENKVCLSSNVSNDLLLTILVHESRHALQTMRKDLKLNVKSAVMINRAQEADAMAVQCRAAYEMWRTEPQAFVKFTDLYPNIMAAFHFSSEKKKDARAAMGAAFKEWFRNETYVSAYDEAALDFMALGKTRPKSFSRNVTSKEIAETLCVFEGQQYVHSAFLESRRATTVREDIAVKAAQTEVKHTFPKHAVVSDTSADYFFIKRKDGGIITPAHRGREAAATLLYASLTEKRGR